MSWALLAAATSLATPTVTVDYLQFGGLRVSLQGVPVVAGSAFQYYEEGWRRGIWSSNWRPQAVTRLRDGTLQVRYMGDNGRVVGTHRVSPTSGGVRVEYQFRWLGERPVRIENTLGFVSATAMTDARVRLGNGGFFPVGRGPLPGATPDERSFGAPASGIEFDGPLGRLSLRVTGPAITAFDARGHSADWARNRGVFWLGQRDVSILPGETVAITAEWRFTPAPPRPVVAESRFETRPERLPIAIQADAEPWPMLPKPKSWASTGGTVPADGALSFDGPAELGALLTRRRATLWDVGGSGGALTVRARVAPVGIAAEGFEIAVSDAGVTLTGQDTAGLRHAVQALPFLMRPEGGRLVLRKGTLRDWPSVAWRGVHMFGGPEALAFQTALSDRVLGPLRFNRAVLQCERTDWEAAPGLVTGDTMTRDDLVNLFAQYRSHGIEPIPLVQSLGHVGWLFANGQNLDIAVNPDVPFTLDPRRARARELTDAIWREVGRLLAPKTVHFGLDEFDQRGIPDDRFFSTRLWQQQVPHLMDIARDLRAVPMVWSDVMLGPGEAIDAMNADTLAEARARRAVVPKGTWVADWHYANNPNPEAYRSLELWRREGFRPIAASWWRGDNIRGHTLAAVQAGAGTLQTTWAGYASNEAGLLREPHQFGAYLLAADYAWSGRTERSTAVGYDPVGLLGRLLYGTPGRLRSQPGQAIVPVGMRPEPSATVARIAFRPFAAQPLRSLVNRDRADDPESIVLAVGVALREVAVLVDATGWLDAGGVGATVEVALADGKVVAYPLRYGRDYRADDDNRTNLRSRGVQGRFAVRVPVSETPVDVTSVRLRVGSLAGGMRLHAVTVW